MKIILLVVAWTWIAVPLGWGVYQSVRKSLPLFSESTEPVQGPPQGAESRPSPLPSA